MSFLEGSTHGGADLGREGSGNRAGPAPGSGRKRPILDGTTVPSGQGRSALGQAAGRRGSSSKTYRTGFGPDDAAGVSAPPDATASAAANRMGFGPTGVLRRRRPVQGHRLRPELGTGKPTTKGRRGFGFVTSPVRSVVTRVSSVAGFGPRSRAVRREPSGKPERRQITRVTLSGSFGNCNGKRHDRPRGDFGPRASETSRRMSSRPSARRSGRARPQGRCPTGKLRNPERVAVSTKTPSGFSFAWISRNSE